VLAERPYPRASGSSHLVTAYDTAALTHAWTLRLLPAAPPGWRRLREGGGLVPLRRTIVKTSKPVWPKRRGA
jgi:hypothetical protein